ncbi:MAG: hypothetical protein KIH62_000605 [Candidatus Kerfeldbacteria bacterium]|nr:hypothetical protein [Candidatus Kerfeldbacteria bacterium]
MKEKFLLATPLIALATIFTGCTMTATNVNTNVNASANANTVAENSNVNSNANVVLNENTNTAAEDTFLPFASVDGSLKFAYNPDWKCVETIANTVVACYPKSRISEEYDAGHGIMSVYMPNVVVYNDHCQFTVDQNTVDQSPIKSQKKDDPVHYDFYREYNQCDVHVWAEIGIDTDTELDTVIH